ncbi:uncharacterized protein EV422DRAFT_507354 [Fimicolochytrium jonesii]|uniref:uncharacterized protein n=1 Tax=Fimicolochytrium jonesii TaxID=1396493 RepID=UPI0022FEBD01|nr:uncharacterized protein EV422DRAFT_507354 [Fimicolochytrium jonesii]KAI8819735.1 hypothetical protein EV422DRAFT_507354 [Fimicolochytrium jonesii]
MLALHQHSGGERGIADGAAKGTDRSLAWMAWWMDKEDKSTDRRDPGVSAELERAKHKYAEKMERIRREMDEEALQAEIRKAQAVQEKTVAFVHARGVTIGTK